MQINLGDFYLETFQEDFLEHKKVFESFQGESSSKFISMILERLLQNRRSKDYPFDMGFVVTLKSNESIGYIFISSRRNDEVYLECSILRNKRGLGYGKMCLDGVTNYLFDSFNIRDIALDIDVSNEASMKTAMACGYYEDGYTDNGKIILRNYNLNYVSKRRKGK